MPKQLILCNETGVTYPSILSCATHMRLRQSNISNVLRGNIPHTGGYTFTRLSPKPNPSPIQCLETGTIYASVTAAAQDLYLTRSNIYKVLNGKIKRTGGYSFKKVDF